MEYIPLTGDFKPELLSRRGELFAWICALLGITGWLILFLTGRTILWFITFFVAFLIFAALSISLGNWMDRKTLLRLGKEGVFFTNGLRKLHLRWNEIREVQVFRASWGRRVQVVGENAHFSFRTLGEVKVGDEIKGRLGFVEGDKILDTILEESKMKEVEHTGSSYYYARE